MIARILRFIVNTPFYPHWLSGMKAGEGINHILKGIEGDVLEVGGGDGSKKEELLKKHRKIKKYTVTDFSSWDSEFEKYDPSKNKLGKYTEIIFGYKKRIQLDKVCDAMDLPFKNNSFDYHLSFSTLEHISDPVLYFKEASRVVRSKKFIIVSVPYLYLIHGGEPDHKMDYFRFCNGFFYDIANRYNLKVTEIYVNTGYGTSFASLTNQWLIKRIREGSIIVKVIALLVSPLVFFSTNVIGYVIDIVPDKRFATFINVKLRKKS